MLVQILLPLSNQIPSALTRRTELSSEKEDPKRIMSFISTWVTWRELTSSTDYLYILTFLFIAFLISVVIFLFSYLFSTPSFDKEKISAYECGFNPFQDARNPFDVRFYLVAILFIIFDLEVSFLFPWSVSLSHLSLVAFWSMFLFLFILTIGFLYEWKKGALDW